MNFAKNARLPRSIQESFTSSKSTTWDRRLYFPSEGRHAEDFFTLKTPTASAGFEPANLGTRGQHATSRPPKPLSASMVLFCNYRIFLVNLSDFYEIQKVPSITIYWHLCIFIVRVYVFLLLSIYSYCSSMYSLRCLCILTVVYVFLLFVHVFLLLSMYSYCCLYILIVRPCILIVVYV